MAHFDLTPMYKLCIFFHCVADQSIFNLHLWICPGFRSNRTLNYMFSYWSLCVLSVALYREVIKT